MNFKASLPALKSSAFRLFFIGQGVSLIGTWVQNITLSWLVYQQTQSVFLLGVVGFADKIPIFLFSSLAGVFVDRLDKYKVVLGTQFLLLIQSAILAVLVFSGNLHIWTVIILSFLFGTINAVDIPARQSFLVEMVGNKEDLSNAIALNSSLFNGARIIGPAVGGLLLGAIGAGPCILVNTCSFISVIIAMLSMKLPRIMVKPVTEHNPLKALVEGCSYAYRSIPIRYLLVHISLFNLFMVPFLVVMPAFVHQRLHGGASLLGLVMAASGVGAFLGAVIMVLRKNVLGLSRWVLGASACSALALLGLSFTQSTPLVMVFMVCNGLGALIHMASTNTVIQTLVDDDKRGRVMSLYTMSTVGIAPFGTMFVGLFAAKFGIPLTFQVGALICLVACCWFYVIRPKIGASLRAAYQKKDGPVVAGPLS